MFKEKKGAGEEGEELEAYVEGRRGGSCVPKIKER